MRIQSLPLSLLLVVGCNPKSFDEYADTAPIRVTDAPSTFSTPYFGTAVVTVSGELAGKPVSRIVSSGAIESGRSPIVFTSAYTDDKISDSSTVFCKNLKDCVQGIDIGATLIPFETWGLSTGSDDIRNICVYSPANASTSDIEGSNALGGNAYIVCATGTNKPQRFTMGPAIADVRGNDGTLVFSGFGLPRAHPLAVVMLGVYSKSTSNSEARRGGLYLQLDSVFSPEQGRNIGPYLFPVPLEDPATEKPFAEAEDAADLGAQVAGAVTTGKNLVFAVSQPSKQRVLVGSYDDSLPGMPIDKLRLHACIEAPDADLRGFGERVLVGDLTGDGAPEIMIGTDPVNGVEKGKQALFMYDGRSLPGPVNGKVCPPWDAEGVPVPCADQPGLSCAGSGFGAALAVGDIDADGKNDLIVGAPLTTVGGNPEAGAIWILPGGSNGFDAVDTTVITVPTKAKAHFGASVAALRTKGRDEPVVGAPGVNEVFTIMCTPLESGFGGDELCLE